MDIGKIVIITMLLFGVIITAITVIVLISSSLAWRKLQKKKSAENANYEAAYNKIVHEISDSFKED